MNDNRYYLGRTTLVYFLANVCVLEVMDVSFDVFPSSRALEEERIKICTLLAEIDPSRTAQYADELKLLKQDLTIQDGLRDVDRSRVHVDLEAVARWAEKELKESFARYKDLLKSGVGFGSPEDFEKAMRLLAEGDESMVQDYLRYPEQEGDSLLIEILEAIKSEYLTNSDYGLDAYLSMRVRHGSLSGHLRGPLEERRLIVSKDESGQNYQDNVELADRFEIVSSDQRSCCFEAFAKFSSLYDGIIDDLTRNRLQIRTVTKPDGIFAIQLKDNPLAIHFVRSRIQADTSFDGFLLTAFAAIQLFLEQSLVQVRDYIVSRVKPGIGQAFEVLRSSLERGTLPSLYAKLNSTIADVIPEVQAAVDRVSEWFVPVHTQNETVVRTIEQIIDIGIEVTRAARKGFSPVVERHIEPLGVRSTGFFSEFTDILFTVFDNVYCHSGNKTSPWVRLKLWSEELDVVRRRIRLLVESEVAPGTYSEGKKHKLLRIKEHMESGEYRKHVNLEGGTGLLKLKRLVSSDDRQSLDFGFRDEGMFFVGIELVRTFTTVPGQTGGEIS